MALRIADRVKETWTGTGTGTLTLGGAVTGFNTFASAFADGVTCYYVIEHASLGAWEIGEGTMGGSGTTLARTSVIASSNSNAAVSFATGTKMVFCTAPATYIATVSGTLTTGSVPFVDSRGRLIEDNTNLSFDDTNNVLRTANLAIGATSLDATFDNGVITPKFQVHSTTNAGAFAAIYRWDATAGGPRWGTGKSRGAAVGTRGALSSGDSCGVFIFEGDDGTNFQQAANITGSVDAAVSAGIVPGRLTFSTTNTSGTATERMRIDSSGNVGIGATAPVGDLHIHAASGSADLYLTTAATGATASDGLNFGYSGGGAYIWNYESTKLVIATNNLTRVTVESDGTVGIGQTSPLSQLDLGGALGTPITTITADTTIDGTYSTVINNKAGSTCTLTLPAAASFSRRKYLILNHQAFTVVSASGNVVPLAGGAATTAILAGTTGKWALIQSDGTNWNIVASN